MNHMVIGAVCVTFLFALTNPAVAQTNPDVVITNVALTGSPVASLKNVIAVDGTSTHPTVRLSMTRYELGTTVSETFGPTFNAVTGGDWDDSFATTNGTAWPDGHYVLFAKAIDANGDPTGISDIVSFVITGGVLTINGNSGPGGGN